MAEDFAEWLGRELDKRGWSRAEAARRGGNSASMWDKVINRYANPGEGFCKAVARAFSLDPEAVMRRAGILAPRPEADARLAEVLHLFAMLSSDEQRLILRQVRAAAAPYLTSRSQSLNPDPDNAS